MATSIRKHIPHIVGASCVAALLAGSVGVTSAGASDRAIKKCWGLAGCRALTCPKPSSTPSSARVREPAAMSSRNSAPTPGIGAPAPCARASNGLHTAANPMASTIRERRPPLPQRRRMPNHTFELVAIVNSDLNSFYDAFFCRLPAGFREPGSHLCYRLHPAAFRRGSATPDAMPAYKRTTILPFAAPASIRR